MNMLTSSRRLAWAWAALAIPGLLGAQERGAQERGPADLPPAPEGEKVLLYRVRGLLDHPASERIQKEIGKWLKDEPAIQTIVLDIDSPGTAEGRIEPAADAAQFLSDLRGVRLVARIPRDRAAGNASALLALAGRDLVMARGARIGYLEQPGVEVPDGDEKAAADARRLFKKIAEARGGLIGRSHLAAAMVSRHHPAIFKIRFANVGNKRGEEVRFLTQDEIDSLPDADKSRKQPAERVVAPAGERLTLGREEAREFGFATPVESDDLFEMLGAVNIKVGEENILNHETGGVLKPLSPPAQTLVNFLNHPVVRFFLILCGTLGLLVEAKMPGTLVPSLVGLACFAVVLISGLYPSGPDRVASTSLFEVILFVVGLGLLAVELLLLPGVIIFGLSGAAACLLSLVMAMVPPASSSGARGPAYRDALILLMMSAGSSALIFFFLARLLPHSRFLSRGIVIHSAIQGTPTADSAIEAQTRAAALIGQKGPALTPLRPAGMVEIDGQRLDVVAEGEFIEKGERVEVIEVDGARVLVRRA